MKFLLKSEVQCFEKGLKTPPETFGREVSSNCKQHISSSGNSSVKGKEWSEQEGTKVG